MPSETLYSDGNVGNGVAVNNAVFANGVQDGNFADADGGWAQNDNWEFTMGDTALTAPQLAGVITMVCNLRYYFNPLPGVAIIFNFEVWDGTLWLPLETFDNANPPLAADPADYVENYDLSVLLNTITKLNGAKFRFVEIDAAGYGGTILVDSIRIVTTYAVSAPAGQKAHNFGFTTIASIFTIMLRIEKLIKVT